MVLSLPDTWVTPRPESLILHPPIKSESIQFQNMIRHERLLTVTHMYFETRFMKQGYVETLELMFFIIIF